jgi:hypothetical protein
LRSENVARAKTRERKKREELALWKAISSSSTNHTTQAQEQNFGWLAVFYQCVAQCFVIITQIDFVRVIRGGGRELQETFLGLHQPIRLRKLASQTMLASQNDTHRRRNENASDSFNGGSNDCGVCPDSMWYARDTRAAASC